MTRSADEPASGGAGTFLLGTGAQKAATTWVRTYLDGYPQANFGPMKEYHVWDALSVGAFACFDLRDTSPRQQMMHILRGDEGTDFEHRLSRLRLIRGFQQNTEAYFDFFASLLRQDGIRLTGDFTPSYSALPARTLHRIRDGFEERAIRTRAVFTVRDPVDRAWSAVRMYFRRGDAALAAREGVDLALGPEAALLAYVGTEQARLRGDYVATLRNLSMVFSAEDVFLGAVETLFTEDELGRLGRFLCRPPRPEALGHRVHASATVAPLDPALRRRAALPFRPVYDHFETHHPGIAQAWRARHGDWA